MCIRDRSTVTLIPINKEVSDSCVEPLPSSSLCLTINNPQTPQVTDTEMITDHVTDPADIPGPSHETTSSTFKTILSTPRKETLSTKRNVKSVNTSSLATVLTKELFPSKNNKHGETSRKSNKKSTGKQKNKKTITPSDKEMWYCPNAMRTKFLICGNVSRTLCWTN